MTTTRPTIRGLAVALVIAALMLSACVGLCRRRQLG
jgi:hypothetical protein